MLAAVRKEQKAWRGWRQPDLQLAVEGEVVAGDEVPQDGARALLQRIRPHGVELGHDVLLRVRLQAVAGVLGRQ